MVLGARRPCQALFQDMRHAPGHGRKDCHPSLAQHANPPAVPNVSCPVRAVCQSLAEGQYANSSSWQFRSFAHVPALGRVSPWPEIHGAAIWSVARLAGRLVGPRCLRRPGRSPPLEPRHCTIGIRPLRPGPALRVRRSGGPSGAWWPVRCCRGCRIMGIFGRRAAGKGRTLSMTTDSIATSPAIRPDAR